MGQWGSMPWSGMIIGPFMMIITLTTIVVVVVLVLRWLGGAPTSRPTDQTSGRTALDILRERFARGEIDKEEYEEKRTLLRE